MSRLLVVDDEVRIVSFVSRALSAEGFTVDGAYDGKRGLELARSGTYDLVVLDLLLPGMDGISVLKSIIETRPDQRVLVLSAISEVATKVDCLELGALDYLPKPFALAELVARVRARLRQPASRPDGRFLVAGGLRLDLVRRVAELHGKSVPLAQQEFLLLQHLMRKGGEVCSREQLLSDLWGYSFDPRSNVVDVCVGRLRSKLAPDVVETVRKVGYRIDGP